MSTASPGVPAPVPARRRWLSSALTFVCLSPAWAQPPVLTLESAVRQALDRAPLLEARQDQLRAAQEESARAGALPDPQLTLGIDNLPTQGPGAFTAGADPMTMRSVGISQSWPSPGRLRAQRALGAANAGLAASLQAATAVEIRQQAADAWISAWGARQEQAMIQALRAAWAQDVAVAEARFKAGTGSAADVLAARIEALDLANRMDAAGGEEAGARASLARWLGEPVEQPLAEAPDFDAAPLEEGALLARLDQQGPLLNWPAREQAAEAELAAARADRLPQWALGMSYGSRARGLSDMASVQLSVSLPLFPHDRQDHSIAARAALAYLLPQEDLP
jgi:outer membrane protein, heavy metal efflux system